LTRQSAIIPDDDEIFSKDSEIGAKDRANFSNNSESVSHWTVFDNLSEQFKKWKTGFLIQQLLFPTFPNPANMNLINISVGHADFISPPISL
jgi:hypothetical protein